MATLDEVADNIAQVLAGVTGIARVVTYTDELNDAGIVGLVELSDEIPYVTLGGAAEYLFTIYIMKLGANNSQSRRDLSMLPQRINRAFQQNSPTTADFWLLQRGTKFGGFLRNNIAYQGFSRVLKVHVSP